MCNKTGKQMTTQQFAVENMQQRLLLSTGVRGRIVGEYLSFSFSKGNLLRWKSLLSDLLIIGPWEAVLNEEDGEIIVRSKQFLNR